ncbi:MAG: DctP family TRAP transporter solute-binding subunit [Acidaminococcaceae bacterium]|nr:DctP family TRAP transporter solute-binding subunit [Acidaminococcaceae bacterium]
MKKKVLAGCLSLIVALGIAGCGKGKTAATGGTKDKPVTLKMNVTTSEASVWQVAAKRFKKEVEEKTGGRYKIQIFSNEQLSAGDQTKGIEMLYNSATDCDLHSTIIHTNIVPRLSVINMPWILTDGYKSADKYFFTDKAPGTAFVKSEIEKKGPHVLALGEAGFRQITNNVRPIKSAKDLEGMKIRIPAIAILVDVFRTFKADPTQMPYSECFTALQQGAIDGEENPFDTIRAAKIEEVQKYMTIWNYCYDPLVMSVSKKTWARLSDADKKIFEEAAKVACKDEVKASRALDGEIVKQFKQKGLTVDTLDAKAIQDMKALMKPVYEKYKDKFGVDAFKTFGYTF